MSATEAIEPDSSANLAPARSTLMKSPDLISQEHPEECLEFWFYMKVKINFWDIHFVLLVLVSPQPPNARSYPKETAV